MNPIPEDNSRWCERLYDTKGSDLLLYGRALGLSHCESEDVLHETFAALLKLPSPPDQPFHYCLRTFRNRALNYKRSFFRRILREMESTSWFEPGSAPSTDATEQAIKSLNNLPPDQREVIVLKIWHSLTFEDIGNLLQISRNTAAGRYRYGMDKLKKTLTTLEYESERSVHRRDLEVLETPRSLPAVTGKAFQHP